MLYFKTATDEEQTFKIVKSYSEEYGNDNLILWVPNQWANLLTYEEETDIKVMFWAYNYMSIRSKFGSFWDIELEEKCIK